MEGINPVPRCAPPRTHAPGGLRRTARASATVLPPMLAAMLLVLTSCAAFVAA